MFGFGKKSADLDKKLAEHQAKVLEALNQVACPGSGGPLTEHIVDDRIIEALRVDADDEGHQRVVVEVVLPTMALKGRAAFEATILKTVKGVMGEGTPVVLEVSSDVRPVIQQVAGKGGLPGIQNVILVASGKGGVGKSTVASNLATALAHLGCKVGLLDADIYGPSAPTMFGIADGTRPGTVPSADPNRPLLAPIERYGVKLMSIGFLVDTQTPMVWRGPMIASAAMQLFKDVSWGELDYLVVDMPPGTGDVQLTISQQVVVAGSVIVSTPQDVALADVIRAKAMFDKVSIPCLGIVENMSFFICDGCSKRHEIFFHGGAKAAAARMGTPFLGEVPIEPGVVAGGDSGDPVVHKFPTSQSALAFLNIASEVATTLATMAFSNPDALSGPTISISGGSLREQAEKKPKKGLPVVS
ncbi:MAG: Mrp/NBP35 family ATP-binding protein [Deltaproteobacteria bacterium]|nr:Mrp/NBP35 family ATP-binding protein [Deltaproteobacteria bacterium]